MAREHDRGPTGAPLDADEADLEEQQHLVAGDEDDDDRPAIDAMPLEAPEADVLEQARAEPWDEEDDR